MPLRGNMSRFARMGIVLLAAAMVSACGGGGGGDSTTASSPPPANNPPWWSVLPYHVQVTKAHVLHEQGFYGQGQTVVVMDSGIRATHQQFENRVDVANSTNLADPNSGIDDSPWDTSTNNGHGTGVSSVVAGTEAGVAPKATIVMDRLWDDSGVNPNNVDTVCAGLSHAASLNAAAANYSVTGWEVIFQASYNTCAQAATAGVVWTVAAGNGGNNLTERNQAAIDQWNAGTYPDVLSFKDSAMREILLIVGGASVSDDPAFTQNMYDYPGSDPDLQARYVVAQWGASPMASRLSDTATYSANGTSYSAPAVAGVVALLRERFPTLTGQQIAGAILASANKTFTDDYQDNTCGTSGTENCGYFRYGQGLVDVEAAVAHIQNTYNLP